MKWKPKYSEPRLVVVNSTMLAPFDEEKCKYCGRYDCTDRGYTLTVGDPSHVLSEAALAQQIDEKLAELIEKNKDRFSINVLDYRESQCVRKLKKPVSAAVIDKMNQCGPDCHRNLDCATGGIWRQRTLGYRCPFRDPEYPICRHKVLLDDTPLVCFPDRDGQVECGFHEEAYPHCPRKEEGKPCYDLLDKYCATDEDYDHLLFLNHRFHAAPCRHCEEGGCKNEESLHYEGACTLNGLMAPCEHYACVDPDHAYTEGVCTYVSSADGKDDRKIFNTSGYYFRLSTKKAYTLRLACRISHNIAKATGLKCLGVRRSASKPLLSKNNPLSGHAIEIDYLYLTHPDDVAKNNSDLIAQAVFDALCMTCRGIGCEEIDYCNFIK